MSAYPPLLGLFFALVDFPILLLSFQSLYQCPFVAALFPIDMIFVVVFLKLSGIPHVSIVIIIVGVAI